MSEIDKAAFGEFLLELRKEKGYTQKDLAEKLFVSDKAVSKWERALSLPTYYNENKISYVADGVFRMNVPGLCMLTTVLVQDSWLLFGIQNGFPIIYLGSLFVPMYIVGKKYG